MSDGGEDEREGRSAEARDRQRPDWAGAPGWVAFAGLRAAPHLIRLAHPSIYGDDVMRIWMLQTATLGDQLFRPLNEHMASVFDTVTWLAWQSAGRRLEYAPAAFTAAAVVPFLLVLAAIGKPVTREAGRTSAVVAVVLFNFAPVHVVDSVWWYPGSNHMWALLFTILAIGGAGRPGLRGRVASFAGAALAPACSAMGWLAGPVAAVRGAFPDQTSESRGRSPGATALTVAAPLLGSALNFAASSAFGYHSRVALSLHENGRLEDGLLLATRAPSAMLLSALLGLKNVDLWLPPRADLLITFALLAVGLLWAAVSQKRGLILTGLALIAGAYLLIYPVRAVDGPFWGLRVARYHLFPPLGLVLLVALAMRTPLNKFDDRPSLRTGLAVVLAAAALALHWRQFSEQSNLYDFPDQPRVLTVLERTAAIGRERGITRRQLEEQLIPVQTRWNPMKGFPVHWMVPHAAPLATLPDDQVCPTIFAALDAREREALCGGMNVGPLLQPADRLGPPDSSTLSEGRSVGALRLAKTTTANIHQTEGWPSFLEYEFDDPDATSARSARYLVLPAFDPDAGIEVWWAPAGGDWSACRGVRWRPAPGQGARKGSMPVAQVPQWDPGQVRRVHLVFRYAGRVTAGPPRLAGPAAPSPRQGPRAAGAGQSAPSSS